MREVHWVPEKHHPKLIYDAKLLSDQVTLSGVA